MRFPKPMLCGLAMLLLQGCHVPLKPYRLQPDKQTVEVPPLPAEEEGSYHQQPAVAVETPDKPCVGDNNPICLAFIELDDMGELFDVHESEVHTALDLIIRENRLSKSEGRGAPIVITFIHGWKNNASQGNDNVAGFKRALQEVYSRFHSTRPVIGIYVGWRGDLIRSYFPVARQFSYFNREATAIRIPGATLSSALTRIATYTHQNEKATVIFVGHSFGGLVLERSVSEAMASEIAENKIYSQPGAAADAGPDAEALRKATSKMVADSRADLVVFINPAGAATEAKQMLDFLTAGGYRYQPQGDGVDKPLVVSLSSTSDLATKVALPIGHGLPYLGFKWAGSFRDLGQADQKYGLQCYDPHKDPPYSELLTKAAGAVPQGSYYLSSAPHMQVLQSHEMLKAVSSNQMQAASTHQVITVSNPRAIADCNPELFDPGLNVIKTFRLPDTNQCFAVQERPQRCNGTPYWIMELDPDVVPDHSTIFTDRFISFLIDVFFSANKSQPMSRVQPQLITRQ